MYLAVTKAKIKCLMVQMDEKAYSVHYCFLSGKKDELLCLNRENEPLQSGPVTTDCVRNRYAN